MTENASIELLRTAMYEAEEYGPKGANSPIVKRAFKAGRRMVFRYVNTPQKQPALYVYIVSKNLVFYRTFLVLQGHDGVSYAGRVDSKSKMLFQVLHGHAINRYIERHHFDGTVEQATRKILTDLIANVSIPDGTDDTIYIHYDGGVFLCNDDNGVLHLRTFIMNRQCSPVQRMKSLSSEKGTAAFKRELGIY